MCISELQTNEVHNLISDDLSSIHVDQMEYSPRAGAVVTRRFQGVLLDDLGCTRDDRFKMQILTLQQLDKSLRNNVRV
jgi:hypothetical protein